MARRLEIIFGRPGSGKTYYSIHTRAPEFIGRRKFLIYCTGETDDARAFPYGPVIRNVRELDGKPCPEAVCLLGSDQATRLAALELALRIRTKLGYSVCLIMDEAHEVWPEGSGPKSAGDFFHTIRHEDGLTLICVTQTPARFSKVVYRTAMAIGTVTWFGLATRVDLRWIEEELDAAAALEVGRLPDRKCIVVDPKCPPPAFVGYVAQLERRVARQRGASR